MPPCCGGNKPATRTDAWCEGTIPTTPTLADEGKVVYVTNTDIASNCSEDCGDDDPDIGPITVTINIEAKFTNKTSLEVTGGISGGTFLAGIQAKLEVASGGEDGIEVSKSASVAVPLEPCKWREVFATLKTVQGKKHSMTASLKPCAVFKCSHGTTTVTGGEISVTVTQNSDYGVAGSGSAGARGGGSCPPMPPSST